jgi:hypothetical protein
MNFLPGNKKSYYFFNALFYGIMAVAMVLGCLFPEAQQKFYEETHKTINTIVFIKNMKLEILAGHVYFIIPLMFFIFIKNIFSAVLTIIFPSLILPFSGCLFGLYQAAVFGFGFAPITGVDFTFFKNLILIILEGQAAILMMNGCWQMGHQLLHFTRSNLSSRKEAYILGIKQLWKVALKASAVLAVAAIYEGVLFFVK